MRGATAALFLFQDGQEIAGRVFEPRDQRAALAANAFLICFNRSIGIDFEFDSERGQSVYDWFDLWNREIEDSICRRGVVRFGVDDHPMPTF